jgi:hypothetical protein
MMRLSFLLAWPRTSMPTAARWQVDSVVLRVGNPGGPAFPCVVPLTSTGTNPFSPFGRGGGGGWRTHRLLYTVTLPTPGREDVQNSRSPELPAHHQTLEIDLQGPHADKPHPAGLINVPPLVYSRNMANKRELHSTSNSAGGDLSTAEHRPTAHHHQPAN